MNGKVEISASSFEELSRDELIVNILEFQETLDDLAHRVDAVKTENTKLKEENIVLTNYIDNLMEKMNGDHESLLQSSPKSKKKETTRVVQINNNMGAIIPIFRSDSKEN